MGQDLDQNPARFLEPDPVEQDLDQNHALLLWPGPAQDLPDQNQDPGQDLNLGPSLDLAPNQFQDPGRGQNQDLVQNRRNWVVIVMMTLARRKREWSVRPLAAMGRPEAEVITKPEVTKSVNESWPEVTLKMRM